jgi:G3E family GTPase
MNAGHPIPVLLLTGFLGSGKTTLLNALLRSPDLVDTAVLVNEFGTVGLDHLLVERLDEHTVLLDAGCLCCTIRDDLAQTLRDLLARRASGEIPAFRRVIIETTGLADPAPILHTLILDPVGGAAYRLDGVVATVDAIHGLGQLARQPESAKQAAVADLIVITKTDLADSPGRAQLEEALARLNPGAPRLPSANGSLAASAVLGLGLYDPERRSADVRGWLRAEALRERHGHHHDPNRHDAAIHSFCLEFAAPIDWFELADALEMLTSVAGDGLLRVKGIIDVAGEDLPRVIHAVQHIVYPWAQMASWPRQWDRRSRIVFIVRGLERDYVESAFRHFVAAPLVRDQAPLA